MQIQQLDPTIRNLVAGGHDDGGASTSRASSADSISEVIESMPELLFAGRRRGEPAARPAPGILLSSADSTTE